MDVLRKLAELWQKDATSVVNGWLTDQNDIQLEPDAEGTRYLEVSCLELGLKFERQRFGNRLPVLQSLISWPTKDARITVSRTLGPSSFAPLHDGGFAHLTQSDVALTGDLPMNSGAVDIAVGLLAAPGDSLLDTATDILNDLAELTQVPQLTTAAPVAEKILNGVDKLLGNDNTNGLLAFQTSIQADRLRGGYLVVTDLSTSDGALEALRVSGNKLQMRDESGNWTGAAGFNYFVLRVAVLPSKPKRWRELKALAGLVENATGQLARARSTEDVSAAGSAMQVAMDAAGYEENLTLVDRATAQRDIEVAWEDALKRWTDNQDRIAQIATPDNRKPAAHVEDEGDSATPSGAEDLRDVLKAATAVTGRLKQTRMRAKAR